MGGLTAPNPGDRATAPDGKAEVGVDVTMLTGLYRRMCSIRYFEERVLEMRLANQVVGSVHLCNGQEAIAVGTCAALDLPKDLVFPTYRGHGWTLACGAPQESVFAELLGRESGLNGGRGGSAYLSAPDYGMYGENSIVGAGVPIAAGAALAAQFDDSGRVTVAVIGDGAMNQGSVHEAMNLAAVRRLPFILVVENNGYSELTPIADTVVSDVLYKRASAYGMKGIRIDGNDVVNVARTMRQVVSAARSGDGPILVEATTERLVGHYIGDAQLYRPAGEIDRAKANEPLVRARRKLEGAGMPSTELDALEAEILAETLSASYAALEAPRSDPSTVLEHLYA
ncbi:MAG TPA: thiamine pyrophosphate-dependent dehydrogenase E1 component subunit alpha [Polyangia bacterium]|jgi:pyruvate dehydrogenase E1 component alpha subunit|nr:thiamine pyrophosphate-dependent dehydrogenase E1 component subunit alpha [Polyangia bacterium]